MSGSGTQTTTYIAQRKDVIAEGEGPAVDPTRAERVMVSTTACRLPPCRAAPANESATSCSVFVAQGDSGAVGLRRCAPTTRCRARSPGGGCQVHDLRAGTAAPGRSRTSLPPNFRTRVSCRRIEFHPSRPWRSQSWFPGMRTPWAALLWRAPGPRFSSRRRPRGMPLRRDAAGGRRCPRGRR
jgi:hypothetical protein